jgi:two-component system response regulator FixJ
MTTEQKTEKTVFVVSADSQWESQVSDVAVRCGMQCISNSSLTRFLENVMDHSGPACLFIDLNTPNVDWLTLHQLMLEKNVEIPVVVVAEESELMQAVDAVKYLTNFVITRPIDRESIREAINSAINSQKIVGHQFAVARNYRRLLTLDDRERSIVDLAVDGAPNKQIANRLGLSVKTIERIRKNAYQKLDVRSTAEMTRAVILGGLHDIVYHNHQTILPSMFSLASNHAAESASR